jgi:hypothetical protein
MHWNSFNFKAALSKISLALETAKKYNLKINTDVKENLEALKILASQDLKKISGLKEEFTFHIILDLYSNALRKAESGMYEDAISRLYRVIELISQYRLNDYGIDTSNAILTNYEEDYKKISKQVYGFDKGIPKEIGLKDGLLILSILKDYLVEGESLKSLSDMFGVIRARDMSIVAHGIQLIGVGAFKNIEALARKFIERVCIKLDKDFRGTLRQHAFIKFLKNDL